MVGYLLSVIARYPYYLSFKLKLFTKFLSILLYQFLYDLIYYLSKYYYKLFINCDFIEFLIFYNGKMIYRFGTRRYLIILFFKKNITDLANVYI